MHTHRWIFAVLTVAMTLVSASGQAASQPATGPAATGPASSQPAPGLLGCWKQVDDPETMLRFEAGRVVMASHGRAAILRVVAYAPGKVVLATMGAKVDMPYSIREVSGKKVLTVKDQKAADYAPIEGVPEVLDPKPLALGKPVELSAARLEQIQADLAVRLAKDQDARKERGDLAKMVKIDVDNTAWLKKLVGEIGWIDANRFGPAAANAAFILAQHSGDMPLMLAALPEILKDVKAGKLDAQGYAMLYDRLHLMMGQPQRFGTQIGRNAKGFMVVMPLDEPEKVEARRKELGLIPLKEYLAQFKQANGGKDLEILKE